MSPTVQLQQFANDVYLVLKNRFFDDLVDDNGTTLSTLTTSSDGLTYLHQVLRWTTMWIDELTTEVDNEGRPVDWKYLRSTGAELGTASAGSSTLSGPSTIEDLIAEQGRYVQVLQDGTPVSNWAVVAPDQISNKNDRITEDMVTYVNGTLIFSREFTEAEDNGTIIGDAIVTLKPLTFTDVTILKTVKPYSLVVLGVAKNATLPDIVQGSLSPAYAQKYTNLLNNAIIKNGQTSVGNEVAREDFSGITGVY